MRSCLIDGEVVCCDERGVAAFHVLRRRPKESEAFLYAFDLLELDGTDLRRELIEVRKATLASILRESPTAVRCYVGNRTHPSRYRKPAGCLMPLKLRPTGLGSKVDSKSQRGTLRKGEMQSENQSPVAAFPVFRCGALAVTPLDQLRLRLPAHEFDLLMQAVKPVAEPDRDALLKDIAAELGQHEVVGPGLLHRIISEVQRRYDVADQRRSTG